MTRFALVSCAGLLLAGFLGAQEVPRFTYDIGGGFTQGLGSTGSQLDAGWNVQGGVGMNFNRYLGAKVQVDFNDLGINSTTLNSLGYPGGNVHIFSATVDPIVHLTPRSKKFDVYAIGGGGLYHWYQQFTQPAVATVTGYSPFFGFYQAGIPTTQILSSYSVNKPGFNFGAGIELGSKWRGKFYAEARWDHMFMTGGHVDYLPVSFGFRW